MTGFLPPLSAQGAPEGILDRCSYVRVGDRRVAMNSSIKNKILEVTRGYGTGRDTLRCLGLATIDSPMNPQQMDLGDSSKFADYEVGVVGPCPVPR